MKTIRTLSLSTLALLTASFSHGFSSPPNFESARITFIQKDVSVADIDIIQVSGAGEVSRRKASLEETINKNNAVITGVKSRAELEFNDGTIARLGQLTSFTFTPGSRDMNLKEGSGLFQVPKGMGGTKIQAGPVTAAITGTTLLLQVLGDRVLLYVYEGSVDLAGLSVQTGQVLTVLNDGKTELGSFDTSKGMASAALFTKFRELSDFKELMKVFEKREDVIDSAVLNQLVAERSTLSQIPEPGKK